MIKGIEAKLGADPAPQDIEEIFKTIPARDGFDIPLRIHRPKAASNDSPLIVYYHFGGYCVGSSALAIPICRQLVQRFSAVCVNVDYRLAPENSFPTPINDCWDALQWVAANATGLGANPAKGFIVGGESSGGNIAIVLTHLAKADNLSPPITGQFLSLASCLPPDTVPERYKPFYHSWEQAENSPKLFGYAMTTMFREAHNPDMNSPLFGAFNDPKGHAGMPPAYFQVCGLDPVRDEALVYEKVLREEYGIDTKVDVCAGLPHAFWQVYPAFEKGKDAIEDMMNGFKWLLQQKS
jgi:acetyl esterase/lipase